MFAEGSLFERVRLLVLRERLAVLLGLAVVAIAAAVGVLMGGPALVGIVGVAIAGVGFVLVILMRRGSSTESGSGAVLARFAVAAVVIVGVIQLVPYGRSHANPPITGEPAWSSPETRELMVNACYGCHSNEVEWPWYSNIAPVSWVVTAHVDDGRDHVNYSEFVTDPGDADETIEVILEGEMPPPYYTVLGLHPEARLSEAEIDQLVAGLRLTPGMDEGD